MARLDLIRFDSGAYGLQAVDDDGGLLALFDADADQLPFSNRAWSFVRTLAEGDAYDVDDPDSFWQALDGVTEITPSDDPN